MHTVGSVVEYLGGNPALDAYVGLAGVVLAHHQNGIAILVQFDQPYWVAYWEAEAV